MPKEIWRLKALRHRYQELIAGKMNVYDSVSPEKTPQEPELVYSAQDNLLLQEFVSIEPRLRCGPRDAFVQAVTPLCISWGQAQDLSRPRIPSLLKAWWSSKATESYKYLWILYWMIRYKQQRNRGTLFPDLEEPRLPVA